MRDVICLKGKTTKNDSLGFAKMPIKSLSNTRLHEMAFKDVHLFD